MLIDLIPISFKILSALPPKSYLYVYGGLDGSLLEKIVLWDLLALDKTLKGFYLVNALQQKNDLEKYELFTTGIKGLKTTLRTDIYKKKIQV